MVVVLRRDILIKFLNHTFTTKKNSDGIGLYIAKSIIEREMGGNLTLDISNGKTTFTIKLKDL